MKKLNKEQINRYVSLTAIGKQIPGEVYFQYSGGVGTFRHCSDTKKHWRRAEMFPLENRWVCYLCGEEGYTVEYVQFVTKGSEAFVIDLINQVITGDITEKKSTDHLYTWEEAMAYLEVDDITLNGLIKEKKLNPGRYMYGPDIYFYLNDLRETKSILREK